jgi:hypothetical protein
MSKHTFYPARPEELEGAVKRYGVHGQEVLSVLCAAFGCSYVTAVALGYMREQAGPPPITGLFARLDEHQQRCFDTALSHLMTPVDGLLCEDAKAIEFWQRVRYEATCAIAALIAGDVLSHSERKQLLGPWQSVVGLNFYIL